MTFEMTSLKSSIPPPCWASGTTEYLEMILNKSMEVFEWGSGASTKWLADRVKFIYSVEHNHEWIRKTTSYLGSSINFQLLYRSIKNEQQYANTINEEPNKQYDLIFIDGRHRIFCLNEALKHIKPSGFILFDDMGRERYKKAEEWLHNSSSISFRSAGIYQITRIYRVINNGN